MKKQAIMSMEPKHMAARALVGAIAGGLTGRYIMPHTMNYADDPAAVNMSTMLDGTIGAVAGMHAPNAAKYLENPMNAMKVLGAWGGAELLPVGRHMLTESNQAAHDVAESARNIKPITQQAGEVLDSPEARGAGVGASAAGLAAIVSGLTRSKTQADIDKGTGRGGMVTKDFLKLVIPAMLAGGVVGNMTRKPESQV